jgi:hypothetical protein
MMIMMVIIIIKSIITWWHSHVTSGYDFSAGHPAVEEAPSEFVVAGLHSPH